jgi:hypothetical protein
MSTSYKVSYVGDGITTNYVVVPDYIRKNHIFVTLDGVATSAYTFFNDQTIQFNTAPGVGVVIEIVRRPPGDIPLNTFTGTVITPTALNENFRQSTQLGTIFQDDAETAITTSQAAVATANAATITANAADAAATQAAIDAAAAVVTSNQADIDATAAVATANQADIDASAAVVTANLAAGDAAAAVITANTAESNSLAAVSTANSAAAAVAAAVIYAPVANLAALALLTPFDGEFFELQDSTGAQGSPLITGVPVGLVGDTKLSFRLRYDDPPGEFVFIEYFSTDPESRYIRIGVGAIVNADINASAAIADTKLATISTAGKVSNSATTATSSNTANAIVTRDASGNFTAGTITANLSGNVTGNLTGTASAIADNTVTSAKIVDDTIVNADINASAAIGLSKLATGALPTAITVASANIVDGTIVNADINASAAIAGTKISPDFGSQNVVTTGTATAASLIPTGSSVPTNGVYLPAANSVAVTTNGLERLRVLSDGKVGVNTSNPTAELHVNGGGLFTSPVSFAQGTNSAPGLYPSTDTNTGIYSPGADSISITTNGVERLRVDLNGILGTFGASGQTALFVATGSSAGTTNRIFSGTFGATGVFGGAESVRIFSNGNIQNTNNSYGAISDIKLKENIVDSGSQWDDLKTLRVRKYNLKEATGHTPHTQIGLIAQEVELVSPGLITETPDCDDEGNDLGTVTKSVNYSVLYMKAVKALQEAMERIEALETKVAALEAL